MNQSHGTIFIALLGLTSWSCAATENKQALKDCYFEQIQQSNSSRTAGDIKAWCRNQLAGEALADNKQPEKRKLSALEKRMINEKSTLDNPNAITPHKRNYLLPVTFMSEPNPDVYQQTSFVDQLDNWEAKYQLSFKAPIAKSLFKDEDVLFFGFTLQSYWQMYNSDISSPFRETNYQPEIFYGFINDLTLGEWTNRVNVIGIEHQSNGRTQPLSRSWNRIYANFIWENDDWIVSFKPWYRLPEGDKPFPQAPDGDDNPDIDKYMGHFEFSSAYKWDEQTFGIMFRNNLRSSNKGAFQLDWTFPMGRRFKGYAQYFKGYGESLIDYNHSVERFGVGVLLTDLF